MQYTVEKFFEAIKDDIYALGFEEGIAFPHNNAIDFFKDNNKHLLMEFRMYIKKNEALLHFLTQHPI